MELSSTSKTLCCKPRSSGSPMYIPGRLRTASNPSSLSIFEASYFSPGSGWVDIVFSDKTSISFGIKITRDNQDGQPNNHLKSIGNPPSQDNFYLTISWSRDTICCMG